MLGPEFQVNTYTSGPQYQPVVARGASGGFIAAWSSYGQDGDVYGIFGRQFTSSGAPAGSEFQINAFTTNNQYPPSVAGDAQSGFVVVCGRARGRTAMPTASSGRGTCPNADGDGLCDTDDVVIVSPAGGDAVDCTDPKILRPSITWNPGNYEKFQVSMGSDPAFIAGTRVTSGDKLTTSTTYTPPGKKWKSACAKAVAANAMALVLYLRALGVDVGLSKRDPNRKTFSQVVQVTVSH